MGVNCPSWPDQILQQPADYRGILGGTLAYSQQVLLALGVHAQPDDGVMLGEVKAESFHLLSGRLKVSVKRSPEESVIDELRIVLIILRLPPTLPACGFLLAERCPRGESNGRSTRPLIRSLLPHEVYNVDHAAPLGLEDRRLASCGRNR